MRSIIVLSIILSMCFLNSCTNKSNSTSTSKINSNNTDTSNIPTPTPNPPPTGNNDCNAPGVKKDEFGFESQDYFKFNDITSFGMYTEDVAYSTAEDSTINTGVLSTDHRFKVRILVKQSPGKVSDDSLRGISPTMINKYQNAKDPETGVRKDICRLTAVPYQKLSLTVRVRTSANGNYVQHTFNEIPVNGCSQPHSFDIRSLTGSAGEPRIEVLNTKWDYACQVFGNPCPMDNIWIKYCYQFSIQLATDQTYDFAN